MKLSFTKGDRPIKHRGPELRGSKELRLSEVDVLGKLRLVEHNVSDELDALALDDSEPRWPIAGSYGGEELLEQGCRDLRSA